MSGIVLKIALEDTHPPVWRRVVVPENMSFGKLHEVIQTVFGWYDMHLHVFEAQKNAYDIVADPEDSYNDYYFMENKIPIIAVAQYEKWIRYTYDFGDDWRHKITFEKSIDDYAFDYPMLLKAKGANFDEDSGGVWGESQSDESYDVITVNAQLEHIKCKNVKLSARDQKKMHEIYFFKEAFGELNDGIRQLTKNAKVLSYDKEYKLEDEQDDDYEDKTISGIYDALNNTKVTSQIEKQLDEWKEFCGDKENGAICKMPPRKTSAEIFNSFMLDDNVSDADLFVKAFNQHPELYTFLFEEKEIQQLIDIKSYINNKKYEVSRDAVTKAAMFGFLSIQIPYGTEAAYIFPAIDYDDRLKPIENIDWKKMCNENSSFMKNLIETTMPYGVIETEALYQIFEEHWHTGIEYDIFLNNIVMVAEIFQLLRISDNGEDGKRYVCSPEIDDVADVIFLHNKYAKNLPYKKYTHKQLLNYDDILEKEFKDFYVLIGLFAELTGFNDKICASQFEMIHSELLNGQTSSSVFSFINDILVDSEVGLISNCTIWLRLMHAWMTISLPFLNGYSRIEYENKTGKNAFSVGVFDEKLASDIKLEDIDADTSLCDMPADIQEQLYRAYYECRGTDRTKAIEQIKKKIKVTNNEIDTLLGLTYIDIDKQMKGCNILDDIVERTGDEEVQEMVDAVCDGMQNILDNDSLFGDPFADIESEQPYRRDTPKVGRNDPCPCGSGKKYKKCCGK
ncbi:IS1096 element passenger TnpR family protein [Agathobacter sp.]